MLITSPFLNCCQAMAIMTVTEAPPNQFFVHCATAPSLPGPSHYRGFTIRHTTLGRTPLDEWSARRRDPLTAHNTLKRLTSKPPAGFEPAIPVSGAAFWIGPPHQYTIECPTCSRHTSSPRPEHTERHSTSGPQALFYFWIHLFTSHVSVHVTGRHNIHAILHCNTVTTDIKRHWLFLIDSSR